MKKHKVFYLTGLVFILAIAIIPIRELLKLCINVASNALVMGFANENHIVPFAGVVISLLLGFLLIPLLASKFSAKKAKIILSIAATLLFIGSSLFAESALSAQHTLTESPAASPSETESEPLSLEMMMSKFYFVVDRKLIAAYPPEPSDIENLTNLEEEIQYIAVDGTHIFSEEGKKASLKVDSKSIHYYYYDSSGSKVNTSAVTPLVFMTRSGRLFIPEDMYDDLDFLTFFETEEQVLSHKKLLLPSTLYFNPWENYIPASVKIHYYLFSIILIISALCLLFNRYFTWYRSDNGTDTRFLILQALSTVFYLLAYLLVKPITYRHFASPLITTQSAISALLCIVFGGISAGFFSANLIQYKGKKKWIPPIVALLTVLLLYAAEYCMLDGRLYQYGESWFFAGIPHLLLSPANLLVILLPALIVHFTLYRVYQPKKKEKR